MIPSQFNVSPDPEVVVIVELKELMWVVASGREACRLRPSQAGTRRAVEAVIATLVVYRRQA
jgi:hypothetical protein